MLVGCLTSQQQACVSQGRICSDNFTCCHTEIEVADPTFYLTQSQYTDTGPTSPSADPITPGAWQGSHWSANFEVTGMTRPRKIPARDSNPGPSVLEVDALTTRPTRRSKEPVRLPTTTQEEEEEKEKKNIWKKKTKKKKKKEKKKKEEEKEVEEEEEEEEGKQKKALYLEWFYSSGSVVFISESS